MSSLQSSARRTALTLLGATLLVAAHPAALADDYPNQPVKLIVPFAAGGSTDLAARLVAEHAGRELGQVIVVENRAGAGGSVGMEAVARAKPDGYTLGMATMSTHGSNPAIYGSRIKYDAVKDFAPVTNVATVPSVLAIHPSVPAKTVQEFIALAKAAPGKYTFASPGVGSLGHANISHFAALAGIELLHVPYRGSGAALNDAIAGQVSAITDNLPSALPHIRADRLRALVVLSAQRSPALPDIPVYSEIGLSAMGEGGWFGIVAPAGTPDDVILKLNRAIHAGMKHPDFVAKMDEAGATLIPGTPADFSAQIRQAMDRYADVVAKTNIHLE